MNHQKTVSIAKKAILADIGAGTVLASVKSFSELHDFVDANCYLEDYCWKHGIEAANKAILEIDKWLRSGRETV